MVTEAEGVRKVGDGEELHLSRFVLARTRCQVDNLVNSPVRYRGSRICGGFD